MSADSSVSIIGMAPAPTPVLKEIQTALRHMAVYGLGNILVKALGFFMIPFYTHYLTPEDYGILEILDLSMSLFALMLNMGLTPALLRCYAAADSPREKRSVISTGCVFTFLTGCMVFFAGLACARSATTLLFGPKIPTMYVLLSFGALILSYMANPSRTYLRALESSGTYTLIDTVAVLLLLVLNIFFIAGLKLGVAGVLWSSLIVIFLQYVLLSGWALRKVGFQFVRTDLQHILRFGIPLVFANIGLFVLNFSDRFFLQHLRSLEVVGIYALGYKFGFMMNYLVVQPFFVMWQSRMYSIHEEPDHRRVFKQIFALYSLGLIYAALAMSLFSPEVVHVMVESKFAAGQDVIPIIVLSYVFYGLSYYAQLGMFLTERTRAVGVIGAVSAGVNIILNYFLIRSYGMMGAAFATVLSFAFLAAVSYWRSQVVFRLPLGIGRMSGGMMLAIAMYMGCRWWTVSSTAVGVCTKLLIVGLFPVLVWKSGILDPGAAATLVSAKGQAIIAVRRLFGISRGADMTEREQE